MDRTLLVTGSSGLLGLAVLNNLVREYRCVGLDAVSTRDMLDGVVQHQVDLRDGDRITEIVGQERVTHLVHAGGISGETLLDDDPSAVVAINVQGTQNVLEAARLAGVQRLVFVSSSAVYGTPTSDVDESSPFRPESIYAASKAAGEMLVGGYQTRFNMETVILRPVSIYGPRRRTASLVSYLIASALDGVAARVRDGSQRIDLVYVDDVARAVGLALRTTVGVGHAYTLGSGRLVSNGEIAGLVRRLVPAARIDVDPGSDGKGAGGGYRVEAAERDLGFRAAWGLESGCRTVVEVLREQPDLREQVRTAWRRLEASPTR
ncbi:MAG TPA: NAD(P)-dependent oxidoreductase [Chloroflexota bacterium]